MISIIYGAKGTGKTKTIIDKANEALNISKGSIVYITDAKDHMYEIKYQIRYIMTNDYAIDSIDGFTGFLKGIIANDHDIEYIFIDGVQRIAKIDINNLKLLFQTLEDNKDIHFTLTVSSDYDNIPDYIKKYIK